MGTYLETDRVVLRPFRADDADLLIELDSDPEVMRYLSGGEPTDPDVRAPGVMRGSGTGAPVGDTGRLQHRPPIKESPCPREPSAGSTPNEGSASSRSTTGPTTCSSTRPRW
ncbi:GNAT family N-acetyltransferase [Cellulomonas gilvus]|uniref:GNAT family N-acetyltransferase n=1 Tax=Cellulomonas gilvus TaxID=11 RepID=UPI0002D6BDE6